MSTAAASPVTAEAIAASVELYRNLAVQWLKALRKTDEPFDALTAYSAATRAYTDEEISAEADQHTANFARILAERNTIDPSTDAYLLLGFDFIEGMPKAK